jgi:carbonic anhydrase/acetyltransferase-like protein (isoleucine patch superfamily)
MRKRLISRYRKLVKSFILNVFYRNQYHPKVLGLSSGQIVTIFFFQKILGYNRHVPFPVHFTSHFTGVGDLDLEEDVSFTFAANGNMYVQKFNGIKIGKGTIIASGVKIVSANHDINNIDEHVHMPPIVIGRNCWIASNAVILAGVELGDNVVVGAGAVVNKSFPSNSVIAGVPAKLIKTNSSIS